MSLSRLDDIQKKIIDESPDAGSILIAGPPGSGKSLVAMEWSKELAAKNQVPVTLIMFNNVLASFCSQQEGMGGQVSVTTMLRWLNTWIAEGFEFDVPYIARFKPDWTELTHCFRKLPDEMLRGTSWGCLIIDEGQDFPEEMYSFFGELVGRYLSLNEACLLVVLADDNQTIFDGHTNLIDIQVALVCTAEQKRFWRLDTNYRNAKEIYALAKYFQTRGTGSTQSPARVAKNKPHAVFYTDKTQFAATYICQLSRAMALPASGDRPKIGVISMGGISDVVSWFKTIKKLMPDEPNAPILQAYVSDRESGLNSADSLDFCTSPSITVLHAQSSKGLEFDVVVIVDLETNEGFLDDSSVALSKSLYVMLSRAKYFLFLGIKYEFGSLPKALSLLPADGHPEDLLVYKIDNALVEDGLKSIEWSNDSETTAQEIEKAKSLAIKLQAMNDSQITDLLESKLFGLRNSSQKLIFLDRLNGNADDLVDFVREIGVKTLDQHLSKYS